MKRLSTGLLIIFFLTPLLAKADRPAYACMFEKPFVFGASISAGFSQIGEVIWARAKAELGFEEKYYGPNDTPTIRLAKKYFDSPVINNVSEIINAYEHYAWGHRQFYEVYNERRELLTESTVWDSLDAFYWPSADSEPGYEWICDEALKGVDFIVDTAKNYSKPLILATVPEEDESQVLSSYKVQDGWYPPQLACLTRINVRLAQKCKLENQCYLIDIHSIVEQLKAKTLEYDGVLNGVRDMRWDGVHLMDPLFPGTYESYYDIPDRGVRYLTDRIIEKVEIRPPDCAHN